MPVKIEVPSVGESVTEGVLARWLKPNGALVKANEPVCELETDKATAEVSAPAAGVLAILVPEGQKVAVGTVIGRVDEAPAGAEKPAPAKKVPSPDGARAPSPPPEKPPARAAPAPPPGPRARGAGGPQTAGAGGARDARADEPDPPANRRAAAVGAA